MKGRVPTGLPLLAFAGAAYVFFSSVALPGGLPIPWFIFVLGALLCLALKGWGSCLILANLALYPCAVHSPVPLVQAALGGQLALTPAVIIHLAVWGALALSDVARSGQESGRHGAARFATLFEARRAPGLSGSSARLRLLNHQGGSALYDRSGYSVLCEAPTGGGKTAGTIIPAVLEWPGSLVVVDVKGEIFETTSGYLASQGVEIVCLNPDAPVHGHNPLATLRRDSHVEIDARNLSRILTNPRGRPLVGNEIHFVDNATTLLTAAILRGIEGEREGVTLADVFYLLSSDLKTELRSWLDSASATVRLTAERFLPHVTESGMSREFMSIHSTALTALDLFKEPLMARLTSCSSFSPATLKERRQAVYYLASTPARLATTAAYVRLLFQGIIETLTRVGEGRRHEVLLVLDEFPVLGRFEFLVEAFGWMRSYGIRALVAIQGYSQLRNLYGHSEVVSLHTRTKIVYPGTDIASSDQLSRYLGKQTIATESKSSTYGRHSSSGKTRSEAGRDLLMPDEVRALWPESAFVLTQGCRPIKARPALWFRDARMRRKVAHGAARLTADPELHDFTPRRRPAPEDVLVPPQERELTHLLDL